MARDPATYRSARRNQNDHQTKDWRNAGHFTSNDGKGRRLNQGTHIHKSYVLTVEAAERKRRERIGGLGRQEAVDATTAEVEQAGPSLK